MSGAVQKEFGLATSSALPAEQLMELMRKDFGIPSRFTDQEARMVLGVLYETALRKLERNAATTPYVLAEDVSVEFISLLSDGGFSGAVVSSESVRQYHTTTRRSGTGSTPPTTRPRRPGRTLPPTASTGGMSRWGRAGWSLPSSPTSRAGMASGPSPPKTSG